MATPASGSALRELSAPPAFVDVSGGREHVMFRAVFRELSNDRSGTHSTKRRDEVSGGGRKPWRQKGTGRARQGSTRSPQWAHGGVVFGPKPRSYEVSLNKKERRLAMRSALADRFANGAVSMLAESAFTLEKTAAFATALFGSAKAAKTAPRTLVVYGRNEEAGVNLERVARNLQRVDVTHVGALDVKDVLGRERLVLTSAALDELAAAFGENA